MQKLGRLWPLVAVGIMFILFIIFATKQENLNVYNGNRAVYTVEKETETEKKIVTNTYLSNDINLTMQIPDGWQHITKDGYDTYVHSASASSVQIQVMSYYPMVNNVTSDSLTETYANRGMTLTEFQFLSNNSYYVIYQSQGLSGVTDYIEYVLWDRDHVAKIVYTFNDGNYDKLQDEIWYSFDSISWTYENPIAEGFYLYYQLEGDFEYAVPDGWTTGTTDSTFYAYEESTGATFAVNMIEDSTLLSDISEIDYTDFLSNGKSNFVLNQFQQSDTMIYGEATYMNGDIQTAIIQDYYANGTYQYILTYEYPVELGSDYASFAYSGLNMTRIFYESTNTESETESETENLFIPKSDMMKEFESENTQNMETSDTESSSNEQAGTLADALVTVADISQESAETIANVWNSLNIGTPTYAEAYKASDTELILLITNDQNINYYIYITKDGTLNKICVGAEDGSIVYQN